MTQTSHDYLTELIKQYDVITKRLNTAIDRATEINNALATAKAEVAKEKNMQALVQEQIRCEKQILQAGR